MKKVILSLFLCALIVPGVSSAAQDTTCVKNAVETRESAVIAAFGKFNTSMTSALEKRKSSLSDAWSKTESSARKSARKSAWSTFKSEKKSAVSVYKSEKKSAWATYKSTVTQTCKVPEAAKEETEKTSVEPTL